MLERLSVMTNHSMTEMVTAIGPKIEFDHDLASLTTFGTGGRARYFVSVENEEELTRAVAGARKLEVPFFLMGGGSNLLVSDSGYDGMVIKLDILGIELVGESTLKAGAGEKLMALVQAATDNSLTGLEFAAGIYGSVGGAIYGNAGAFGGEIGSLLIDAEIAEGDGQISTVDASYFEFGYRDSNLKRSSDVVVRASFGLERGDRDKISAKVAEIIETRNAKHPVGQRTAGCVFKNIPDASQPHGKLAAGKLLEEAGAKQMAVGGAKVFENHANMIINTGNATSKDIRQLADKMKESVRDKFGVELQEEIILLGDF